MTFHTNPLSYCTNLHPGQTVDEVLNGLRQFTVPAQQRFGKLAAGLWLARPVITELLASAATLQRFKTELRQHGLSCYTLNTFPFGNFHQARVKENVYLPDWSSPERLQYTIDCARVLAELMDDDLDSGSMSTVPLGFKPFHQPASFQDECADQLIRLARELHQLAESTGKYIRLAVEPEPYCVLETTPETIAFFRRLRQRAETQGALMLTDEYLGVCYDVCHQSVEFEDVQESIRQLDLEGVRIHKVHITCAIRLERPAANEPARQALAHFAEPRYLHQTFAQQARSSSPVSAVDLTPELALQPPVDFAEADEWRVHFHVPVNAESIGPLATTRPDLKRALMAVKELDYAPHLEVETYTWGVLPDGRKVDLVDGLVGELTATRELLTEISSISIPTALA